VANLYVIAAPGGPCYVGTGQAERVLAGLISGGHSTLAMVGQWEESRSAVELIKRVLAHKLADVPFSDEWYSIDPTKMVALANAAVEQVTGPPAPPEADAELKARCIKAMREELFGVPLALFAKIAGASLTTAHRWEKGELEPSWSEMKRLRTFAIEAGFQWSDTWLFDPTPLEKQRGKVVDLNSARRARNG
jgi:DNA-binding transcriptional regulator YiaG